MMSSSFQVIDTERKQLLRLSAPFKIESKAARPHSQQNPAALGPFTSVRCNRPYASGKQNNG
jgi:hypothetical protein